MSPSLPRDRSPWSLPLYRGKWRQFPLMLLAISALLLGLWVHPSHSAIARVSTTSPQMGDTISVIIQADPNRTSDPQVQLGAKTYPAFPLGPNQYRTLVPTTPLMSPGGMTLKVSNGTTTESIPIQLKKRWFPTQRIWLPPDKDKDLDDYEFDQVDAFKKIVSPQKLWNGKFIRPNNGVVTTVYGVRRYYNGVFANDYYHRGVDYGGYSGSAVVAPAAGRVELVGREASGFEIHGNCVGLDHGQGVASIFLHLTRIDVKPGDMVQAGQQIGTLGSTGASTGPHLHWGLYVFGEGVDPVPWRYDGFQ